MFKNVASQKIALFAFDSSTGVPKSGDAANLTAYVNKDYAGSNVLGDTLATEIDSTNAKGWYLFDLTQAETDADSLLFTGKSSTSNIVLVGVLIQTVPANFTTFSIDSNGRITAHLANGTHGGAAATISLKYLSAVNSTTDNNGRAVSFVGSHASGVGLYVEGGDTGLMSIGSVGAYFRDGDSAGVKFGDGQNHALVLVSGDGNPVNDFIFSDESNLYTRTSQQHSRDAMALATTASAAAGSIDAKLNTIVSRVGTATITVINPMTSDGNNYEITLVAGDDYTESLDCAFEFATADWWPSIDSASTVKMTIKEGGTVIVPAFEVTDWSDADGVTVELLTTQTKILTNACEKAYTFDIEATIGGLYKTLARGYITALADRTEH